MSSKIRAVIAALSAEAVSLEAAESTQGVERELVYYAKLTDLEALKALAIRTEDQEQWELRSPLGNGRFRCRVTHGVNQDKSEIVDSVIMTFKVNAEGGNHVETEQEVSQDVFDAFRQLAPNGMRKTRYVVPVTSNGVQVRDLVWEVDVYADTDWVKIDLELNDQPWGIRCYPQVLLPTCFTDVFTGTDTSKEDFRRELYEKYFLLKNPLSVDNKEMTHVSPTLAAFKSVPMGVTVNENMKGVSTEGLFGFLGKKPATLPTPPRYSHLDESVHFLKEMAKAGNSLNVTDGEIEARFFYHCFEKHGVLSKDPIRAFISNVKELIADSVRNLKYAEEYADTLRAVEKRVTAAASQEDAKSILLKALSILESKAVANRIYEADGIKHYLGGVELIQQGSHYKEVNSIGDKTNLSFYLDPASSKKSVKITAPSTSELVEFIKTTLLLIDPYLKLAAFSDIDGEAELDGKHVKAATKNYFGEVDHSGNSKLDAILCKWLEEGNEEYTVYAISNHFWELGGINTLDHAYMEYLLICAARYVHAVTIK